MTKPLARLPERELGQLLSTLDVEVVALAECVVSSGYALETDAYSAPGIHYCLTGGGRIVIGDKTAVDLEPHTLIIIPAVIPFRLENRAAKVPLRVVDGRLHSSKETEKGVVPRFSAGDEADALILVCGFFRAFYGSTVELFASLSAPIVERFDAEDKVDARLKEALDELATQEVGFAAMSSALLKLVIVALLRRELCSTGEWVERFALLKDPNIMRAFAAMAARPGADHSVESLAQTACLSRSAFMKRFSALLGRPPMDVLRELRMRQAAMQLEAGVSSMDQVARDAGYKSQSSFARAFAKVHGRHPNGEAAKDPDRTSAPRGL